MGQYIYAIGGNEEAARLSGVPVRFTKAAAYVDIGLRWRRWPASARRRRSSRAIRKPASGYELTAIAMVVIGGTSLNGGRGGIGLTLMGRDDDWIPGKDPVDQRRARGQPVDAHRAHYC